MAQGITQTQVQSDSVAMCNDVSQLTTCKEKTLREQTLTRDRVPCIASSLDGSGWDKYSDSGEVTKSKYLFESSEITSKLVDSSEKRVQYKLEPIDIDPIDTSNYERRKNDILRLHQSRNEKGQNDELLKRTTEEIQKAKNMQEANRINSELKEITRKLSNIISSTAPPSSHFPVTCNELKTDQTILSVPQSCISSPFYSTSSALSNTLPKLLSKPPCIKSPSVPVQPATSGPRKVASA